MGKITLEKMEFHAYHGCLDHEKALGNNFEITVSVRLDTSRAEKTDILEDTLNYKKVYDTVAQEMHNRVNLIEHLAHNIAHRIMTDFEEVEELSILLSKLNPPIGGKVDKVSIEINKKR